jgi:hypothetical protein
VPPALPPFPVPLGTLFASGVMHRTVLCHSLAGNPLPLLTITDFSSGPAALAMRPYIVLSARVHPGETNASWMMRGVLDLLTSSAPVALELRRRAIFKVVPFLNPDGVVNGHHRTNLAGLDLNRHWSAPDPAKAPTVWHLRALILALQARVGRVRTSLQGPGPVRAIHAVQQDDHRHAFRPGGPRRFRHVEGQIHALRQRRTLRGDLPQPVALPTGIGPLHRAEDRLRVFLGTRDHDEKSRSCISRSTSSCGTT